MKLLRHSLVAVVELTDDDGHDFTVRIRKDEEGNLTVLGTSPDHAIKYASNVARVLFGLAMEKPTGKDKNYR